MCIIRAYNWDVEREIPLVTFHSHENYFIQDEHTTYFEIIEASVVLHNYLMDSVMMCRRIGGVTLIFLMWMMISSTFLFDS